MGDPAKISILLADEDALRREGLSAVLSANSTFEVIADVADGAAAISRIRGLQPDVAVIDLNLPRIHGIELVRQIRAESLPTKIVILAGTADDEIVREVVRAGADAYLLKNGPSRHLIDAISYVRDGGQYFSPQLGRSGRDRHLLEEPARTVPQISAARPAEDEAADNTGADDLHPVHVARTNRKRTGSANLRQRLRDESPAENLNDRDYEIMSMMADGIRPILDRLDEIDSRVSMMESGDADLPGDPRAWISTELVRSLGGKRGGRESMSVARTVDELEARLPHLIEDAVNQRFSQMAEKLQQEIEETHVRTLETFVKNIQVKLVQRVTALEGDMSRQADAMNQLREYSQRTEENLGRLITGVDKLAQDLPRRLAAVKVEPEAEAESNSDSILPLSSGVSKRRSAGTQRRGAARGLKIGVASLLGVAVIALVVWQVASALPGKAEPDATTSGAATEKVGKQSPQSGVSDIATKLQDAQTAMDHTNYSAAEQGYRGVLQTDPNNADAIRGLASALFRQDKADEAAAVLDKLPKN